MALSPPYVQQRPSAVGNFKRILSLPCAVDPVLLVDSALPAALHALVTVLLPDEKEIYHKVSGEALVHTLRAAGDDVAEYLPEEPGIALRSLLKAAPLYDIAIWWIFLAEVFDEGLINWTSQIIKVNKCTQHGSQNSGTGSGYLSAIFDDGSPGTPVANFQGAGRVVGPGPIQALYNPGDSPVVAASLSYVDLNGLPQTTNTWTEIEQTGIVMDFDQSELVGENAPNAKVWTAGKQNGGAPGQILRAQSNYLGLPVPAHELFVKAESEWAFLFLPR